MRFFDTFKGATVCNRESLCLTSGGRDIQAMTTFRRSPAKFLKHLKKTQKPLILTVNGKAEAVVQDAECYQRLLDIAALADAREGTRQGLEDVKKGRVGPARSSRNVPSCPCHTSLHIRHGARAPLSKV